MHVHATATIGVIQVTSVCMSGDYVAVGSWGGVVQVWNRRSGGTRTFACGHLTASLQSLGLGLHITSCIEGYSGADAQRYNLYIKDYTRHVNVYRGIQHIYKNIEGRVGTESRVYGFSWCRMQVSWVNWDRPWRSPSVRICWWPVLRPALLRPGTPLGLHERHVE